MRTVWLFFKCPFFIYNKTFITQNAHSLNVTGGDDDFGNIGKYASEINNLEERTLKLCKNLSLDDQKFVIRQIALAKAAREKNDFKVYDLTKNEKSDFTRMAENFSVFKISDNLFFYDGYFLPVEHFEAGVFFYKHSLPEIFPQNVLNKIRQKDIIDVGGFIGDSAIIFEREFCDKNIYSFEPTKKNFEYMQKVLELNNSKRIVPVKKGLGAKNESCSIAYFSSASSIIYDVATHYHVDAPKETIKITTLDEFVAQNNLEIGFIKVDTEGFEQPFLAGAKKTICTQKPALLISIYHSGDDYFNIKPMIESWNLGYQMRIHKGTDGSLTGETALYCYLPE